MYVDVHYNFYCNSSGPHLEGLLPLELLETRRKSSHKRKELEGSLGIDKRLMELVVGKEEERDGVMDLSSEEDSLLEEQGRAEEPSLSDPDHPLCDLSLLNGLIYLVSKALPCLHLGYRALIRRC